MASFQGVLIDPDNSRYPVDYYGNPEYREMLMRFDFAYECQGLEVGNWWSDKYPGRRPLGIARSGRFAIYLMRWIPRSVLSRGDLVIKLCRCVPPTDTFMLSYLDSHEWRREKVNLPLVMSSNVRQPATEECVEQGLAVGEEVLQG